MRVRFDEQIFLSQRHGGISSYFANVIREFRSSPDLGVAPEGFPILSTNEYLRALGLAHPFAPGLMPQRRRAYVAVNAVRRTVRRRMHPDLLHPTFYFDRPPRGRFVTTVHDMTPELLPDQIVGRDPHFRKAEHVHAADAIACVSETTAADLRRIHPEITAPITVTPLAVGSAFRPRARRPSRRRSILFVGTRAHRYKNFEVFVRAAAEAAPRHDLDVVVAGGGAFTDAEVATLERAGLSDRVRHVLPSDEQLSDLYAQAELFVFPSSYEGFGLPVLEAMASGCAVIASDAPALVEVADRAALHVPAGDVAATIAAIDRVLTEDGLAADLRRRGLERAARASWTETARATVDCYRTALE